MTDEEAKERLERLLAFVQPGFWTDIHDAIQAGYNALKEKLDTSTEKEA